MTKMMELYTWSKETFPQLTDMQHDMLCALQDAGGLLSFDDVFLSSDFPCRFRGKAEEELKSLCEDGFVSSRQTGAKRFFELSPMGNAFLNSTPPAGVEV